MNKIVDELKKYFIFDRIFNLVEYDDNMSQLYFDLKELQKESYDPTYRFVFIHYDTDYYITNDQPGLTLRNLQRLLKSLDISNYFCLILTGQRIQNQLDILRDQETNDAHSIYSINEWTHPWLHPLVGNIDSNVDLISKKYICLNGVNRFHRTMLYAFLRNMNLLDQGIVSYGNFEQNLEHIHQTNVQKRTESSVKLPLDLRFLYTDSFTRIHNGWIIKDAGVHKMLQSTPLEPYKNFEDTYGRYDDYAIGLSQQAFLYVVSETTFNYPTYQISEKSIKPIVSKRPFLLVSGAGSLKMLKSAGFKTFSQWWDESYDDIVDPTERMKAVVKIIELIASKSISELKLMYTEMQEVIDYNFNYHQTMFYNNELLNFKTACKNNLGHR